MVQTRKLRRLIARGALLAGGLFVAIQLVPYGRSHTNPAVVKEPDWDQPATRELAVRACFDCHSNETHWPLYSEVAPVSWLMQRHVDEGREALNFSEWQRTYKEAGESAETVDKGEMPIGSYLLMHPAAQLTAEERKALAQGLTATLGTAHE